MEYRTLYELFDMRNRNNEGKKKKTRINGPIFSKEESKKIKHEFDKACKAIVTVANSLDNKCEADRKFTTKDVNDGEYTRYINFLRASIDGSKIKGYSGDSNDIEKDTKLISKAILSRVNGMKDIDYEFGKAFEMKDEDVITVIVNLNPKTVVVEIHSDIYVEGDKKQVTEAAEVPKDNTEEPKTSTKPKKTFPKEEITEDIQYVLDWCKKELEKYPDVNGKGLQLISIKKCLGDAKLYEANHNFSLIDLSLIKYKGETKKEGDHPVYIVYHKIERALEQHLKSKFDGKYSVDEYSGDDDSATLSITLH